MLFSENKHTAEASSSSSPPWSASSWKVALYSVMFFGHQISNSRKKRNYPAWVQDKRETRVFWSLTYASSERQRNVFVRMLFAEHRHRPTQRNAQFGRSHGFMSAFGRRRKSRKARNFYTAASHRSVGFVGWQWPGSASKILMRIGSFRRFFGAMQAG